MEVIPLPNRHNHSPPFDYKIQIWRMASSFD